MERWFTSLPWWLWLSAALMSGLAFAVALLYWWLEHPVDDEDGRPD